jgi:SAM-dependent methyltransferase
MIFDIVIPRVTELDNVLEIGCGSGLLSFKIIPLVNQFVGYDLSKEMIKQCEMKLKNFDYRNAHFFEGDVANPPDLGKFDKILLVNVLHIVDNPEDVLVQVKKYLTEKTKLMIVSYCHGEKMSWKFKLLSFFMKLGSKLGLMGKLHKFTFEELRDMICRNGFEVIKEQREKKGFPFLFVEVRMSALRQT